MPESVIFIYDTPLINDLPFPVIKYNIYDSYSLPVTPRTTDKQHIFNIRSAPTIKSVYQYVRPIKNSLETTRYSSTEKVENIFITLTQPTKTIYNPPHPDPPHNT